MRFALRRLRHRKHFVLFATLSLGLGLGGSALAVVATHAAVQDAVPVTDAHRLVWIGEHDGQREDGTSLTAVSRWHRESNTLEEVTALTTRDVRLQLVETVTLAPVAGVSATFFKVVGVPPLIGRSFIEDDDRPGAAPVAIISDKLWKTRFGGSPSVLGRTLVLDRIPYSVVGVMPAGFDFPGDGTLMWLPVSQLLGAFESVEGIHLVWAIGRLRLSATASSVMAELRKIEMASAAPVGRSAQSRVFAESLRDHFTHDLLPRLKVLIAAAIALLLVGCANVGNMLVGEVVQRTGELSVRRVLGASRQHMFALLVAEASLLLGGAAGTGLLFVRATVAVATRYTSAGIPDTRMLTVTRQAGALIGSLALLIAVGLGALCYFQTPEDSLAKRLRMNRSFSSSRGSARVRSVLISWGVALALVLLLSAGVLAKSYLSLSRRELGIDPTNVYIAAVNQPFVVYTPEDRPLVAAATDRLLRALATLPQMEVSAVSTQAPGSGNTMTTWLKADVTSDSIRAGVQAVSERFFDVLRIGIRHGRTFTKGDDDLAAPVAVVDERIARIVRGSVMVGRSVALTDLGLRVHVVGIVGSVRQGGATTEGLPQVYVPYTQLPLPWMTLLMRSNGRRDAVRNAVAVATSTVASSITPSAVRSLTEVLASRLEGSRFYAVLLIGLASVAVILTAVSLYGTIALSVMERKHEVGIRMSIGASPARVVLFLMRQATLAVAVGALLGLALAFAGTRLLVSLLYGISPLDPWTIAVAVALICAACGIAGLVPALRASAISPANALRYE